MKRQATALLAAAVLAAACDLDVFGAFNEFCAEHGMCAQTADGGLDAGGPLDTWCEDFATAFCERRRACNYSDLTGCYEQLHFFCAHTQRPAARHGALRFDLAAADACLAHLTTTSCAEIPFGCPDAFRPNAALNERCETDSCTEGFCPPFAEPCAVCRPFYALDEACQGGSECGPAAKCESLPDGGARCTARALDGETCSSSEACAGGQCTEYFGLDAGPSRCGHLGTGAACDHSSQCVATEYCAGVYRDGFGGQPVLGVCAPRHGPGAACADEQYDDGCPDAGSCVAGICTVTSSQPRGAPCDQSTQCARGTCSRDTDTLPDGGPWREDGVCRSGLDLGDACGSTLDCFPGLYCAADGGCAPSLPLGATCTGGACGDGICLFQGDGGFRCGTRGGPGAPCVNFAHCKFGYRCAIVDAGLPLACQDFEDGHVCQGSIYCRSNRCSSDGTTSFCAPSCFP